MVPLGLLGPLASEWLRDNKVVGCPHPHVPSGTIQTSQPFVLRLSTDELLFLCWWQVFDDTSQVPFPDPVFGISTVGHQSHDPCSRVFLMEAGVMTFGAHCTCTLKRRISDHVIDHVRGRRFSAYIKDWRIMISDVQEALISGCWIRSEHGCFQRFFKFVTRWPQSPGIWYPGITSRYVWYSAKICQIRNWNLVNFLLISVNYTFDIRLISGV